MQPDIFWTEIVDEGRTAVVHYAMDERGEQLSQTILTICTEREEAEKLCAALNCAMYNPVVRLSQAYQALLAKGVDAEEAVHLLEEAADAYPTS